MLTNRPTIPFVKGYKDEFLKRPKVGHTDTEHLQRKYLLKREHNFHTILSVKGKGKGKVHHRTGHEGARWGGWLALRPGHFTLGKRPVTHYTGGWVGPRAGLEGCGKSRVHRDSIPEPSSP